MSSDIVQWKQGTVEKKKERGWVGDWVIHKNMTKDRAKGKVCAWNYNYSGNRRKKKRRRKGDR